MMFSAQRPATILNVDDNDTSRYVKSRLLRRAGFEVLEAANGKDALSAVQARKPDLAILDVNLPDISGFELCRKIKSNPDSSSVFIVQVSATAVMEQHRVEGLEAGADSYLVEPLPERVLLATINSLLRLRRAEEGIRLAAAQWQTTFDSIEIGVCLVDLEGRVLRLNRAMARLLKLPAGEGPERISAEIYRQFWPDAHDSLLSLAISMKREAWEVSLEGRWFEFAVEPVFTAEGSLAGAVHTWTDITARKRAEESRARALEREREAREFAEAANRSKDQFLATLSHELRSPLQSMLGWLYMLRQGTLGPEESRRALETIEQNARAQAQLIDDLLDVSRIISGKLRLDFKPVDLRQTVQAALDSQKPAADAKGILVQASLAGEVGAISGDSGRLQQVVTNLLANAIKFTPRGGRVEVQLEREGSWVRIRVLDTGVGISANILPYIFDRFRQGATEGSSPAGLGLGLAIVRHLVEIHGGTVQAESGGEGQGATFTVRLPLAGGRQAVVAPGAPADSPQCSHSLEGLLVLVVDDEPDLRRWMGILLRRYGAEVMLAGSSREALELFRERRPNLVVSDIGMPMEDGYALIRRIRELGDGAPPPAVALSARARDEDRREALAAGYLAHLAKPVEAAELLAVLQEIVRRNPGSVT